MSISVICIFKMFYLTYCLSRIYKIFKIWYLTCIFHFYLDIVIQQNMYMYSWLTINKLYCDGKFVTQTKLNIFKLKFEVSYDFSRERLHE